MTAIIEKNSANIKENFIRTILLAKDQGAILVCENPLEFIHKAYSYGITGVQYISFNDFSKLKKKDGKYVFYEIDKYVQSTLGETGVLVGYSVFY